MKKTSFLIGILLCSFSAFTQNSVDVLRYSQTFNGGSARFMSMGGAFGALGADFSVLSTNPAGIGVFKKSIFTASPSVFVSNTKTTTGDWAVNGHQSNFNMNNYGFVIVQRMNDGKPGWKGVQFGMGVNRLNNFNKEFNVEFHNNKNSLITDYHSQAYGNYPNQLDPFTTDLAWKTYLFKDTVRVNNGVLAYTSALNNGGTKQTENVLRWGSVNEMVFSVGGSYNDKIYIGGTVGFPFARFFEKVQHKEYDDADTIKEFDSFTMNRYLETHGNGVNFKIGVIVRPISLLRLGFSFESPTWYNMHDYYYNDMVQVYDDGTKSDLAKSPNGDFDYDIVTPMKLNGSAALIFGRFMIVSAEVQYLDYSSGYLDSRVYTFSEENADVKKKYRDAVNVRAGVELRMRPMAFRVGAAYFGNPYQEGVNENIRYQVSGGLGYRDRDFYFDLAYIYSVDTEDYYMYDPVFVEASSVRNDIHKVVMTIGMKF